MNENTLEVVLVYGGVSIITSKHNNKEHMSPYEDSLIECIKYRNQSSNVIQSQGDNLQ